MSRIELIQHIFLLVLFFRFLIRIKIFEQGFCDDSTKSEIVNFFNDYVRYSVKITVYRLQTECFMSFFSDVIGLSNLHLNNLQGIYLPFGKIHISNVKYSSKTYTLVYYSEGNTAICVFRKIWTRSFRCRSIS